MAIGVWDGRGTNWIRWLTLAVVAALPSLVWALRGPDLLTDDFGHALAYRSEGLWAGMLDRSFDSTGRPLVGSYYLLTFGLIGDNPTAHAIVLGGLNVGLVLVLWQVGRRVISPRLAWLAALFVAIIPNRDSTRLWFSTGNYVLATALVIIGFGLLAAWNRPRAAAATLLVAVLLFEGVVGLAGGLVLIWLMQHRTERFRTAILVGLPSAVAAGFMYLASPKRSPGGPSPSDSLSTIGEGLLGQGVWGSTAGRGGTVVLLAAIVWALVTRLPSFYRSDPALRMVLAGTALAVTGAVPFIVGGSPFAVEGVFDRTNLVPGIGVCLVLAAVADLALRSGGRVALLGVVVVVAALVATSLEGVNPYRDAVNEGTLIAERVITTDPTARSTIFVVPRPDEARGIAQFIYPHDLDAALTLRTDLDTTAVIPWNASDCREGVRATEGLTLGFDWRQQESLDADIACERL